nr:hypothetical protein [Tanacetum cinerariifolium]
MDEDILFLERLLIEEPCPNHTIISNQTKLPIEEPKHSFKMGYEHFNTNLVIKDVTESSTKNLVPIPHECEVVSENGSESIKPVNDNSLVFTTISTPLFDNDKINSDEINSHVESNSNESTSNHDTESKSRQEEIDVVTITDDVLPPSVENEDSDEEVDAVVDLRVDNFSKILSMSILRVRIPTLIIRQFHYHLRNHQMKNLILRLILQKKFLL